MKAKRQTKNGRRQTEGGVQRCRREEIWRRWRRICRQRLTCKNKSIKSFLFLSNNDGFRERKRTLSVPQNRSGQSCAGAPEGVSKGRGDRHPRIVSLFLFHFRPDRADHVEERNTCGRSACVVQVADRDRNRVEPIREGGRTEQGMAGAWVRRSRKTGYDVHKTRS